MRTFSSLRTFAPREKLNEPVTTIDSSMIITLWCMRPMPEMSFYGNPSIFILMYFRVFPVRPGLFHDAAYVHPLFVEPYKLLAERVARKREGHEPHGLLSLFEPLQRMRSISSSGEKYALMSVSPIFT